MKNNLPKIDVKDWLNNFTLIEHSDLYKIVRYTNYGQHKQQWIEIVLSNSEGKGWTINWPAMGSQNIEDTYLFAQVLQKAIEIANELNN